MLFPPKNFDTFVKEMKSFGEFLMPYTNPKVKDDDINFMKARDIILDGYNLVVYYSKVDYKKYYSEILQITSRYAPFLPFSIVCKIGKRFLGNKNLSFVEFIKDNRKVYCWTIFLDRDNNPIEVNRENLLDCVYEGLQYRSLNPSNLNFY